MIQCANETQLGSKSCRKRWVIAFITVALMMLFIWALIAPKNYSVTDVTKPQTIMLHATPGASNIQAITIRLVGKIDGNAMMTAGSLPLEVAGDFDVHLGSLDCYSTNYFIEYLPDGVTKGKVFIRYKFLDTSILGEIEREISKEYRTR